MAPSSATSTPKTVSLSYVTLASRPVAVASSKKFKNKIKSSNDLNVNIFQ